MKALNRAIGRTVSQIARHAGEGRHVPMLMALENHLDALLTMERKQLELAGIKISTLGEKSVVSITSPSAAAKDLAQYILHQSEPRDSWLTPEQVAALNSLKPGQQHANDNAPPAPDVINMNDPRNWLAGDVVKRKQYPKSPNFTAYREYTVAENDGRYIRIKGNDGTLVSYPLHIIHDEEASSFFAWIRHGDSEVAA